ncbi:hypothetical protein WOC76_15695 [Methylocystis sp. IM3]|uniref:hypothetical protein n=1 Tax=unclassified Methylocystis TaxID=2625913 RepID=UPI0030F88FC0
MLTDAMLSGPAWWQALRQRRYSSQARKCRCKVEHSVKKLAVGLTQDSITLSTRVTIEVRPANFRTVRSGTVIAAICDEVAYWRSDSLANPDREILAALQPALANARHDCHH